MKTVIKKGDHKKLFIPMGKFADGDWFKCQSCGNTIRKLVRPGDPAYCSECGGRMIRI